MSHAARPAKQSTGRCYVQHSGRVIDKHILGNTGKRAAPIHPLADPRGLSKACNRGRHQSTRSSSMSWEISVGLARRAARRWR
eukprot:2870309-Alexandrium_andersonii.AAC.1